VRSAGDSAGGRVGLAHTRPLNTPAAEVPQVMEGSGKEALQQGNGRRRNVATFTSSSSFQRYLGRRWVLVGGRGDRKEGQGEVETRRSNTSR